MLRCADGEVVMSAESPEGKKLNTGDKETLFLDKARQLLHKRLKVRSLYCTCCELAGLNFVMYMKVVVKDGRILVGDFLCIDKQGNLILGNTYQQVPRQVSSLTPRKQ